MSGEVEKIRVTCIVCPIGCTIEIIKRGGKVVEVRGYGCPRGREYAIQEAVKPMRVVMSVVLVEGGDLPTVSVKTDRPVPKELIPAIMKELSRVRVKAPVSIGQVILENVAGSGANIIATRPVARLSD